MTKNVKKKKINQFLSKKKLFIFDLDGTLIDSNNIKSEAFKVLFSKQKKKVQDKIIKHHLQNGGISREIKIKYYLKYFIDKKSDKYEFSSMKKCFKKYVKERVIAAKEISGSEKFLKHLKIMKKDCIINSGTPQTELRLILKEKNWDKYFSSIYGSPRKKSENILIHLKKKKYKKSEIVFFGDSKDDYKASKSCYIDYIHLGNNKIYSKHNKKLKFKIKNYRGIKTL